MLFCMMSSPSATAAAAAGVAGVIAANLAAVTTFGSVTSLYDIRRGTAALAVTAVSAMAAAVVSAAPMAVVSAAALAVVPAPLAAAVAPAAALLVQGLVERGSRMIRAAKTAPAKSFHPVWGLAWSSAGLIVAFGFGKRRLQRRRREELLGIWCPSSTACRSQLCGWFCSESQTGMQGSL